MSPYNTLPEALKYCVDACGENTPFCIFRGQDGGRNVFTYGRLHRLAGQCAAFLRHRGVEKGSLVTLCLPNSPERLVCEFGVLYAGAVCVNGLYSMADGSDLFHCLRRSRSATILLDPDVTQSPWQHLQELAPRAHDGCVTSEELPHLKRVQLVQRRDGGEEDFLRVVERWSGWVMEVDVHRGDNCYVFTTSGTTGFPKLLMHTHDHFVSLVEKLTTTTTTTGSGGGGGTLQQSAASPPSGRRTVRYQDSPMGVSSGNVFISLVLGETRVLCDVMAGLPADRCAFIARCIGEENCNKACLGPAYVLTLVGRVKRENMAASDSEKGGTVLSSESEKPGTVLLSESEKPGTVLLSESEKPGTAISESEKPGTVLLSESEKAGTVLFESEKRGTVLLEYEKPATVLSESEKPGTVSSESEKRGTVMSESERQGTILSESKKPETVSSESEKRGTVLPQSEKPGNGLPEFEKPGNVLCDSKKQETVLSESENQETILSEYEKPGTVLSESEKRGTVLYEPEKLDTVLSTSAFNNSNNNNNNNNNNINSTIGTCWNQPLHWNGRLDEISIGGQPVTRAVVDSALTLARTVLVYYGSSELGLISAGLVTETDSYEDYNVGHLVAGAQAKIVDEWTEMPLAVGQIGLVLIKHPTPFLEYLQDSKDPGGTAATTTTAAAAAAFTPDGFCRTGDRGKLSPDNTLSIFGRTGDAAIMRGQYVYYPFAIESRISSCAGVADVVVVGVPDPLFGQEFCACLVLDGDVMVEQVRERVEKEVVRHGVGCWQCLAPHYYLRFGALPQLYTGRPDRRLIKEIAGKRIAAYDGH